MSDNPAGWKPDPRGRHEYRYWDGTQWTDHVSDQGEVSQDPVADTSPPLDVEKSAIFTADDKTVARPTPESAAPPAEAEPAAAAAEEPAATEPAAETTPEPAPTAAASAGPPTSSAAPPGGTAAATPETPTATAPATPQTDAKAAAQEVLHGKSPELATILSAVIPGSGHFYMGSEKVPLAVGLLVATVAALVLSWMSFLLFLVGFVIWLGAAAFALTDLRGGVSGIEETTLPKNVTAVLLIGAGALMVLSLFLPWYRVSGGGASLTGSGFETLEFIDIVLLIIGAASILAGAAALGLGPVSEGELPRWLPTAVAVGGAVAAVLVLFRMFVDGIPDLGGDVDVGRGFGIWFDLWAALILVIANAGVLKSLTGDRS